MNARETRLILVHRRTRLQALIARHNTLEQARFVVESRGGDFQDYVREDRRQTEVLQQAEQKLKALGRVQVLERDFLPNYLFGPDDIIVVVGQDGLVANTMKYLDGHPVVAINPDPDRYEGVLLPFVIQQLSGIVRRVINGRDHAKGISLARASLSDGQELLAVNDFFIGPSRHTTASYVLGLGERQEAQMSSGVVVSTGLGKTGWFRSIVNGSVKMLGRFLDEEVEIDPAEWRFDWSERRLLYVVREPYVPEGTTLDMVIGSIGPDTPLTLESTMGEDGVIFSDGMLDDALAFRAGVRAEIGLAEKQGRLVI